MRLILILLLTAGLQAARITSGEFAVEVTASDLRAFRGPVEVLSLRSLHKQKFDSHRKQLDRDMLPCESETTIEFLSLTGPYLAVREDSYDYCKSMPHPALGRRVLTFDLRNPAAPLRITALFPEPAVIDALRKDRVLARFLKTRPASLKALHAALPESGVPVGQDCTFELAADFDRFGIHHAEGSQVAVRITLTPIGPVCRGETPELGVLLPAPAGPAPAFAPRGTPKAAIAFEAK